MIKIKLTIINKITKLIIIKINIMLKNLNLRITIPWNQNNSVMIKIKIKVTMTHLPSQKIMKKLNKLDKMNGRLKLKISLGSGL